MLLKVGLIDQLLLFVHPIWLGEGIPLFTGELATTHFQLEDSHAFDTGLLRLDLRPKA